MHWFWRATIAVLISFIISLPLAYPIAWWLHSMWNDLGLNQVIRRIIVFEASASVGIALTGMLFSALAVGIYAFLGRNRLPNDGETRCRKCGYILRGIPEPRCSECGERI